MTIILNYYIIENNIFLYNCRYVYKHREYLIFLIRYEMRIGIGMGMGNEDVYQSCSCPYTCQNTHHRRIIPV